MIRQETVMKIINMPSEALDELEVFRSREELKALSKPLAFDNIRSNEEINFGRSEDEMSWPLVYTSICMLIVLNILVNYFWLSC